MQNIAQQVYHQERQLNDIDLVTEVRNRLIASNVPMDRIEAFDTNSHILDAMNKTPEVQRYFMNRYWNLQLLSCHKYSIEERYCLIPNGEINDWVRLFNDKVLPFIVANELPVRI